MNKLFVLFFIFLSLKSYSYASSFNDYVNSFEYKEATEIIYPLEKKEFERIEFSGDKIVYPDKLIRLYLLVSGIVEEKQINEYLNNFDKAVSDATLELKKISDLNNYNKAEFLLHYLHRKIFLKEITGSGAGYNIGIKETLDNGAYNCYKSALVYNSFLQFFGFNTSLVIVPEHIYSTVQIDGHSIEVETTNKYGFDPYDRGSPKFKRKFDAPGVIFNKKNYPITDDIDNISVTYIIYMNRMLLYLGDLKYSGLNIETDVNRAAALGILGSYLNRDDQIMINNLMVSMYSIMDRNLKSKPENLEYESDRFLKFISRYKDHREYANSYRNLCVTIINTLPVIRKKAIDDGRTIDKLIHVYQNEYNFYEKYMNTNLSMLETGWNNTTVDFIKNIEEKVKLKNIELFKEYTSYFIRLFENDEMKKSQVYDKYRKMASLEVTQKLNNLGVDLFNARDYENAKKVLEEGVKFLKEKSFYDERTLKIIEKNINSIK